MLRHKYNPQKCVEIHNSRKRFTTELTRKIEGKICSFVRLVCDSTCRRELRDTVATREKIIAGLGCRNRVRSCTVQASLKMFDSFFITFRVPSRDRDVFFSGPAGHSSTFLDKITVHRSLHLTSRLHSRTQLIQTRKIQPCLKLNIYFIA